MNKRHVLCGQCGVTFEVDKRGPVPQTCLTCRPLYYHFKYKGRYRGRYQPHIKETLLRSEYRCEDCGASGVRLYVHHRDEQGASKVKHPNNDLSNLIALCAYCHMMAHNLVKSGTLETILKLRKQSLSLQAIAIQFGVSRQRIHQIITKGT